MTISGWGGAGEMGENRAIWKNRAIWFSLQTKIFCLQTFTNDLQTLSYVLINSIGVGGGGGWRNVRALFAFIYS